MKKILLVEDDPEIVMLLHLHFSLPGYSLGVCSHGMQAIEKALDEFFDLILLDIALPDVDGIKVCQTLLEKRINRPIIMLASRPEEIEQVLELGDVDYVTKPFSIRELQERVKTMIHQDEQIQQAQTGCE